MLLLSGFCLNDTTLFSFQIHSKFLSHSLKTIILIVTDMKNRLLLLCDLVILSARGSFHSFKIFRSPPFIGVPVHLTAVVPVVWSHSVIGAELHHFLDKEDTACLVIAAGGVLSDDHRDTFIDKVGFHHSVKVFHLLYLGVCTPCVMYVCGAKFPGRIVVY